MSRAWSLPEAAANAANPLSTALTQYPVLEMLVSHLRPGDLVTLTTTCQAIQQQIRMGHAKVKKSLLRKTLCPGLGREVRMSMHCPCRTPGWHEFAGCAGEGYDAASKPCIECGINTCDECRIHLTYQVFVDDAGLDHRRWWAGYLMMLPYVFGLQPPEGIAGSAWHLPPEITSTHHDEGRLHIPLHVAALADSEPLDRILDINLGRHSVTPWGRTTYPYDGENVVNVLKTIAVSRSVFACQPCCEEQHQRTEVAPCSCTFRKRFLDRWMCIPCHLAELKRIQELRVEGFKFGDSSDHLESITCRPCGSTLSPDVEYGLVCAWCDGFITDAKNRDESYNGETSNFRDNDDDEENAGPIPENAMPGVFNTVDNKDGTMAVYCDGTRISGERISRALVRSRALEKGIEMPCTCCKCSAFSCAHHAHDHDGDHENDGHAAGDESLTEHADADRDENEDEDSQNLEFDEDMAPDVWGEDEEHGAE